MSRITVRNLELRLMRELRRRAADRAFFNWAGASHRPQQADWEKAFAFYERHLG